MSNSISLGNALNWLDSHINIEKNSHSDFPAPSLVKIHEALRMIGEPHKSFPAIHVTGTNGKGSTCRMITGLLMAHGLRVGTYMSPHLTSINERILVDLEPISDQDLVDELSPLKLLEEHSGKILSWFELVTAAAFSHFDTVGIEVGVIEVGMGGAWDATNVIDGDVAVVTNISWDHADILGPELADIAREKSGIIKPSSSVILGVDQSELLDIFLSRPNIGVSIMGQDLQLRSNSQAIGGRVIAVRTKHAFYDQIFMPLFGPHQGRNAALAISTVEEFFGRALDLDVVRAAFERTSSPGRMEVVSRSPLVVLDAAHNPAGMLSARLSLESDFSAVSKWHLVVSMLRGRDPKEMFFAISNDKIVSLSIAQTRSLRAMEINEIRNGAEAADLNCTVFETVSDGVKAAVDACKEDEGVLVCGSIYTVAEAREEIFKNK
ncbi:MAG: bifunctional folylpolyglutamate synthase/dihydrofolate synthase [Acidimicrobiaceae bacterium]|nr:bifunctional folylpolyglutamate synthase/dihydrofolate synthase [Acidimicrobiaceae bacterium]